MSEGLHVQNYLSITYIISVGEYVRSVVCVLGVRNVENVHTLLHSFNYVEVG